jgi:hypothetical protein
LAEGTIYILNNVPKTTSNLPKAPMSPPIECEKVWQRGYSGPTHEEIVISEAFAEAVFLADQMIITHFKEQYSALTSSMRQMQTPALLSCDLHRKGLVPDVPSV